MVMDFACWLDQLLTQHNVHTANAAGALCKCNETAAAAHPFSLHCRTHSPNANCALESRATQCVCERNSAPGLLNPF